MNQLIRKIFPSKNPKVEIINITYEYFTKVNFKDYLNDYHPDTVKTSEIHAGFYGSVEEKLTEFDNIFKYINENQFTNIRNYNSELIVLIKNKTKTNTELLEDINNKLATLYKNKEQREIYCKELVNIIEYYEKDILDIESNIISDKTHPFYSEVYNTTMEEQIATKKAIVVKLEELIVNMGVKYKTVDPIKDLEYTKSLIQYRTENVLNEHFLNENFNTSTSRVRSTPVLLETTSRVRSTGVVSRSTEVLKTITKIPP